MRARERKRVVDRPAPVEYHEHLDCLRLQSISESVQTVLYGDLFAKPQNLNFELREEEGRECIFYAPVADQERDPPLSQSERW